MTLVDGMIVLFYLLGMISLSAYLGRRLTTSDDYFVGGRRLPWWAVGISTMATQTSAISFISIPAFVAIKPGGGLTWLQYEMAVPLAMMVVIAVLVPFFRRLELVSVYAYLEQRFDRSVRSLVSWVFLVSRGLATGVALYASGIVLSVCLDMPLWTTILIIGAITVLYDLLGGIAAVVYSDVMQMMILLAGLVACITVAARQVGGLGPMLSAFPADRRYTVDLATGIGDGATVPFWAFLFGGFVLYMSYYGTDQSQVQRELASRSAEETRRSLLFNGLARFPLTVLYMLLGIAIYAVHDTSPALRAAVPPDQPDALVPQFILQTMPPGLRGALFAALLAAAMSSLDSALNSLSAVTMRDVLSARIVQGADRLRWSRRITLAWGFFITLFAFVVGTISDTVIEAINKVGAAFYGPVLATFLAGILSKRATARGSLIGIAAGVGLNLVLWLFVPSIHWMWWNVLGCATTACCALLLGGSVASPSTLARTTLDPREVLRDEGRRPAIHGLLAATFVLILAIVLLR